MAQPTTSLGLLRPAACTRSAIIAPLSAVPLANGIRRRLAFRSKAWRARLVGCRAAAAPAMPSTHVMDEFAEGQVQLVDASSLPSTQFKDHDTASQTLHQLQDLVARMQELQAKADEELESSSEWVATPNGFTVQKDTWQGMISCTRKARKEEKRQQKVEKAAARQARRAARASGQQHITSPPLSIDLSSSSSSAEQQQQQQPPAPAAEALLHQMGQRQQQQPEQQESLTERRARRARQRLERVPAPLAAAQQQEPQQHQQQQQQPQQLQQQQLLQLQPSAADAAAAAVSAVMQRRPRQQPAQPTRSAAQQPADGRARRRRGSTSVAAQAATPVALQPSINSSISTSTSTSSRRQPEEQPAASRVEHGAPQAVTTEAAAAPAAPAAPATPSDAQVPQPYYTATVGAAFVASQPLSGSSSSSSSAPAGLGFVPLVLERSPAMARGGGASAAARASRRIARGASVGGSRSRPIAAGAAVQAAQCATAPMPEQRKLVDNNINGLDMRVELLAADQERELALMVQDLLQLEGVARELGQRLGRPPTDVEWMDAAGAAPQAEDVGAEDVRAAVQLFQGRLQHGRAAKQVMISANYKLVVSICRKYVGYGMALGDLINEGIAGLVKGVERFEPSKGCKFSTYAHWWIRQAITRSLQEQGRLVRLPSHLQEMLTKMTKVSRAFEAQYGREPTLADLAAELGVETAKISDAYEAVFTHRSLDQPMGDGEGGTLGDVLEDERALGSDDAAYVDSLKHDLEGVLANLPAREAGVLRMRFGLVDGTERTLDEIGLQFNVTRERIRQIEAKAIRQLRARQLQPGSVIADYQEGSMDSKQLASRSSSGTKKQG